MPTFLPTFWPVLLAAGGAGVFLLGMAVYASLAKRKARLRRRAPDNWPLTPRPIINSEERRVWRWLELAFVDYSVMVKMPVTRFSSPNSQAQGAYWYELLSSLYCSFTVVRADGKVMGCVDLPSRAGRRSKSQRMKAALLAQCGIPYLVLQDDMQPNLTQMRATFLGAASAMPQSTEQAAAIQTASMSLRSSISRNRETRHTATGPQKAYSPRKPGTVAGPESGLSSLPTSGFSTVWQDDSFIMPLDSRRAPLTK
jgi:hypothetical protein